MATLTPPSTRLRWSTGVGLAVVTAVLVTLVLGHGSRCSGGTLAPLLVAAVMLGALAVRVPREAVSLLPGALLPAWLMCGAEETAAIAFAGALAGGLLRGGVVPAGLGTVGALAGVIVAGFLGDLARDYVDIPARDLAAMFPADPTVEGSGATFVEQLLLGAVFMLGYWAGEHAAVWLTTRIAPDRLPGLVPWTSLVANVLMVFPGVVIAEVLAARGPLLAAFLLALLVLALVLIGLYTGAEAARHTAAGDQARLQSIVAYAPDGIFAVGPDLKLEWLNDTAGRLTGWSPVEAVGQACADVVRLRARDGSTIDLGDQFVRAARSGAAIQAPATLQARDGVDRPVVVSYTAVAGTRDAIDVGVGAVREVEENQEGPQAIQGADLGHELRSPLTAILGYAQMLSNPPGTLDPARQAEFATRILSSGDYMLRLVNNLLDLRRMESGAEQLQPARLQLELLLRTTLGMLMPRAAEKEISLSLDVAPDLPPLVSDELLVRRVLDNLISNAVKYTPAGGSVRVAAAREGEGVAISVVDTGIGLTEDEQERLFERFFRSGRPEARQERGTGLGLSLVREAARRLGGEVRVTSAVGEGSTFTFWIPREPPATAAPEQRAAIG